MSDDDMIRRGDALKIVKYSNAWTGAYDEIAALPAAEVSVKPLEWVEIREGQYFEARVIGILYSVRLGSDGVVRWQAGHLGAWHEVNSIEAAKADAQADYDARIRSALTAQPSPDVAALVEAADKLLDAYSAIVGAGNPWGDELRAALARVKGGEA